MATAARARRALIARSLLARDRVVVASVVPDDGLAQGQRLERALAAIDDAAARRHHDRVRQLALPLGIDGIDEGVRIRLLEDVIPPRGALLLQEREHGP